MRTTVSLWFDTECAWCWITSRWLLDVAEHRDVDLRWRTFSLLWKRGDSLDERGKRIYTYHHGLLRVIEAARDAHGDEPIATLYSELGRRIHHEGDRKLEHLPEALTAVGLDPELAGARQDERWDKAIQASMDEVLASCDEDVGTPLIRFGDAPAFFGPILSPKPEGEQGLRLFDGLMAVTQAGCDSFWELKRHRTVGAGLPPLRERSATT